MIVQHSTEKRHDLLQAAQRRAITELLFFCSVGDVRRCQRLCTLWHMQVTLFSRNRADVSS